MIPAAFIEHFIWAPQLLATIGEDSPVTAPLKEDKHEGTLPIFRFTGGVQATLDSLVALAFSEAERPRSAAHSVSDVPPEKSVVLTCPTKEGTPITLGLALFPVPIRRLKGSPGPFESRV